MEGVILFVDDDPDDLFLVERACRAGVREFAGNGKEAVARLLGEGPLPRLIFLDLNMPLMGGLEFLEWVRSQPRLREIPVVILTTSENPRDICAAYELGACSYLIKPTRLASLTELLGGAIRFWVERLPS